MSNKILPIHLNKGKFLANHTFLTTKSKKTTIRKVKEIFKNIYGVTN